MREALTVSVAEVWPRRWEIGLTYLEPVVLCHIVLENDVS